MNKRLKIFVTASVLLNVLLIGFSAGQMLYRPPPPDRGEEIASVINDPALKERARKIFGEEQGMRSEIRKAREASLQIIETNPFDAKAYIKAMNDMGRLHDKRRERMTAEIAAIADKLSPDERAQLAEVLRTPPPGHRPR